MDRNCHATLFNFRIARRVQSHTGCMNGILYGVQPGSDSMPRVQRTACPLSELTAALVGAASGVCTHAELAGHLRHQQHGPKLLTV